MKTNFDIYKKELELLSCGTEFGVNKTTQIPYSCDRMNCGECLFNKAGYTCGQCRWKWLGIEYKEFIWVLFKKVVIILMKNHRQ